MMMIMVKIMILSAKFTISIFMMLMVMFIVRGGGKEDDYKN